MHSNVSLSALYKNHNFHHKAQSLYVPTPAPSTTNSTILGHDSPRARLHFPDKSNHTISLDSPYPNDSSVRPTKLPPVNVLESLPEKPSFSLPHSAKTSFDQVSRSVIPNTSTPNDSVPLYPSHLLESWKTPRQQSRQVSHTMLLFSDPPAMPQPRSTNRIVPYAAGHNKAFPKQWSLPRLVANHPQSSVTALISLNHYSLSTQPYPHPEPENWYSETKAPYLHGYT